MAVAFILTVWGNKLSTLNCEITTAVKEKLGARDVFMVNAKVKEKGTPNPDGVLVTVESPSRFMSPKAFMEGEVRLNATFYVDTIVG